MDILLKLERTPRKTVSLFLSNFRGGQKGPLHKFGNLSPLKTHWRWNLNGSFFGLYQFWESLPFYLKLQSRRDSSGISTFTGKKCLTYKLWPSSPHFIGTKSFWRLKFKCSLWDMKIIFRVFFRSFRYFIWFTWSFHNKDTIGENPWLISGTYSPVSVPKYAQDTEE